MTEVAVIKFLSALTVDSDAQKLLKKGLPHAALQLIYTSYGDELNDLDKEDEQAILSAAESANSKETLAQAIIPYLKEKYGSGS